jgi:hypothetical protein
MEKMTKWIKGAKNGRKMVLHSSKLVMDNASSVVVCHVTEFKFHAIYKNQNGFRIQI